MGSCIAELGKTLWEELIKRAISELRYPCCYTCIVDDLEKEKKGLEAERETVGQRVEAAKNRGDHIQSNATVFEEQANKLIQVDTKTKKTWFFGLCPNCIWRYRRGKELAEKIEDIRKLMKNAENLVNVGLPSPVPDIDRHSSKDYVSFKSRESKYKELLDALTNDDNYITGLQGMGGTGKTTLAKEVGKELKQRGRFALVIDTTVSFTPDVKKIQDEIAGPLGLKWDDCTDSERPGKLWKRLTNGEKILLILDDVWRPLDFGEIGIPSSDNCQGCKVLLTTRESQVCKKMGCKTIHLEILPEEEAWTLFKKHADMSDRSCESLLQKGHEIVKECKGLPVAIAIIGSSLKGSRSLEEWELALNSLQKHMPTDEKDTDENLVAIYKSLKYSFDYMKDNKAKGLFLFCSVFREDEQISTQILTRYGIGVGLLGEEYQKYNDARREVVVAKNKLVDSCLLLKDGDSSVKMHDLVREAAQWIANGWIQTVILSDSKSQKSLVESGKTKYLLCHGKSMDVFSMGLDGSELEILIVSIKETNSMEIPNSFFQNMTRLRVFHLLNMTRSWEMQSPQFSPQSIQSLTSIRSLLLESFKLGDMSILGNLRILETLDLVDCSNVELPGEIAKLEKLRLLNLDHCKFIRESSNNTLEVIERCSSLEELYLINNEGVLDESVANHLIRVLQRLQRYHLVCDYYDEINDSISKCVTFPKIDAFVSEATFKSLVQTAEILGLKEIHGGWRNLMPEIVPIDKGMNDLKELYLTSCSRLQCLIGNNSHEQKVFTELVVLELENMENLEQLCNGALPSDFLKSLEGLIINDCIHLRSMLFKSKLNLSSLKTIQLRRCQELVSLFQLSTSRSLKLLEVLVIFGCEKLENIIVDHDDEDMANKDNKSRGSMFPNLKTLQIRSCPQLKVILPFHSALDVPVLEHIIISECSELKYIFGQYQHKHDKDLHQEVKDVLLGSLKEMRLWSLPNFIDIFPECDHPMCSSMKRSSSKDGSKAQLQSDPIKCNIFPWKYRHKLRSTTSTKIPLDQPQDCSIPSTSESYCLQLGEPAQCLFKQSNILSNITWIALSNVSKIKSVFTLAIAQTLLLEELTIEKCDELKHIISGSGGCGGNNGKDVFPKLKRLSVGDCEQLEYIFEHYSHDLQNHSEMHRHLPALKCLHLDNLPNFIGMCPENYSATLPTLTEFELKICAKFAIKSIGHFINHLYSRHIEGLSGSEEYFVTLESLQVYDSKAENIFCLDEMIEQQMNLGLQKIYLGDMPRMTYLFVGPKNSFVLQNLLSLEIARCEKLEVIFSASISRCLPRLHKLIMQECKELKQIVEEEMEDLFTKTCFPELQTLVVEDCNKLKCVFPTSICKELPKLKFLMIKGADELKEVFGGEGDQKVEIPNLILVAFAELPSLCQGIQLQNVVHRLVLNCPKLSLTSAITPDSFKIFGYSSKEWEMESRLRNLYDLYTRKTNIQDTSNENPIVETTEDQAALERELISSQVNTNHSIQANSAKYNQHENGIEANKSIFVETTTKQTPEAEQEFVENVPSLEIPSISKFSPTNSEAISEEPRPSPLDIPLHKTHSHNLNETEDQYILEDSKSKDIATEIMPVDSETRNVLPIPLHAPQQKDIKINVEEGTTSTNIKIPTSSTHLESVSLQEDGDSKKTIPSFLAINIDSQETTKTQAPELQNPSSLLASLLLMHLLQCHLKGTLLKLWRILLLSSKVSLGSWLPRNIWLSRTCHY